MALPDGAALLLTVTHHLAVGPSSSWLAMLSGEVNGMAMIFHNMTGSLCWTGELPRILERWPGMQTDRKQWQQVVGRSDDRLLKLLPFWLVPSDPLPPWPQVTLWQLFSSLTQLLSVVASVTQKVWPVSVLMSLVSTVTWDPLDPPHLLHATATMERH